jgi:hypothetical protein
MSAMEKTKVGSGCRLVLDCCLDFGERLQEGNWKGRAASGEERRVERGGEEWSGECRWSGEPRPARFRCTEYF